MGGRLSDGSLKEITYALVNAEDELLV